MKIVRTDRMPLGDATALVGIVAGMAMLFQVYLGSALLALPALAVLAPSLLYGMR